MVRDKRRKAIKAASTNKRSLIAGQSNLKEDINQGLLLFNFKFFDSSQGQHFNDWEEEKLLSQAFDVFKSYSSQTITEAVGTRRFKCYECFPEHSKFTHPRHVPEDAVWASMHIQGRQCVIGHLFRNVFYVVFLDKEHDFYPTDLQDR